jgi:hypothetical protein
MSVPRQRTNAIHSLIAVICGTLLTATLALAAADPVVSDPQSGIAISGFDPVAYFTDASAKPGRADLELHQGTVTWRFRNEGNRAAFADNPDVYAPQFGGYDPVAIARGVSVAGHPQQWLVSGQRLYLFYDAKARAEFAANPQRIVTVAEQKWADVRRSLP